MPGYGHDFAVKGFLDTRSVSEPTFPILGKPLEYTIQDNDVFVLALSDPASKKEMANHFISLSASFFQVIHPENSISPSFLSGQGLIIAPYNSISNRVTFGDFVSIYGFCKIGHDVQVGSFSHISSHCSIDGFNNLPEESSVSSFTKYLKSNLP